MWWSGALRSLAAGTEAATWPQSPPRLVVVPDFPAPSAPEEPSRREITGSSTITASINGVERSAANAAGQTLLDWLRFDLGLTGH